MSGDYGYAGKILKVDLSSGQITHLQTSDYAGKFVGGRGVAAGIYWDAVPPDVRAFDPENCLIFVTGPLTGIGGLGARWEVCGKSPATRPEHFCHSNLGGNWGASLKFAGYDGLVIRGKSDKAVCLYLCYDVVEIRDASDLRGKGAIATRQVLQGNHGASFRVVAIGPAGENQVTFANVMADNDASGASGFGAVMGSKNLKAIAVHGSGKTAVAQPERLKQLIKHIHALGRESERPENIGFITGLKTRKDCCYGCPGGCFRAVLESADGQTGKFMCQSGLFYQGLARRHYGGWNEVPFQANKLCDEFGVDTYAIQYLIDWLSKCHAAGILNDQNTGLPLSKIGSFEFIENLVKRISFKDGFGEVLALGVSRAAETVGTRSAELISDYLKGGYKPTHDPRIYLTASLLSAMEERPTQSHFQEVTIGLLHNWLDWADKKEGAWVSSDLLRRIASRFWGGEQAVDFSTPDGKALAAKMIQDREAVKHSLILCTFMWPFTVVRNSEDHVGDPTIESKLFSTVTGKETDEQGLYRAGEAIFNLQRAILIREGHEGRGGDTLPDYLFNTPVASYRLNPDLLVPGKNGEIISRKGAVLDRQVFEHMKDEYYALRGWNVASGLQTRDKLRELGLVHVAADLEQRGLTA